MIRQINLETRALHIVAAGTLILILGAVGCSPRMKGAIDVPNIPTSKVEATDRPALNVPVAIGRLHDGRSEFPGEGTGSSSKIAYPEGRVVGAVQDALSKSLAENGLLVTRDAPIAITGEILEWHTEIKPGVSKDVESKAKIYLEAENAAGKKIFSGEYSGIQEIDEPIVSENDVNRSLGEAMQLAISHLLEDREFLDTLVKSAQIEHRGWASRRPTVLR